MGELAELDRHVTHWAHREQTVPACGDHLVLGVEHRMQVRRRSTHGQPIEQRGECYGPSVGQTSVETAEDAHGGGWASVREHLLHLREAVLGEQSFQAAAEPAQPVIVQDLVGAVGHPLHAVVDEPDVEPVEQDAPPAVALPPSSGRAALLGASGSSTGDRGRRGGSTAHGRLRDLSGGRCSSAEIGGPR